MLNNQIIIADDTLRAYARRNDQGVVDAAGLPTDEWEELRCRNANSPKARKAKCAKCWELYREVQWLKTYNLGSTRVISHQRGESRPDHDYEPVEAPEHEAWKDRAVMIGEPEGYKPRRESWAPGMKTRADVLLTGTLTIAYEHQRSKFSATGRYSAPERARYAEAVGRTPMWHTTMRSVQGHVPILRTDELPPEIIRDLNYRHEFRGGIYRIEIYTCTVRDGHECPNRKFSGCGKSHARGQVTAGQLDDVLRGAPIGAYMPVVDANVIRAPRFFWTDRKSYDRYLMYVADPDAMSLLDGAPADRGRTWNGSRNGHSRAKELEFEAMRVRAVDLSALATPAPERIEVRTATPAKPDLPLLPTARELGAKRLCSHWQGPWHQYCKAPATRYVIGWRCPEHTPAHIAGRPEPPHGPGWPAHRGMP